MFVTKKIRKAVYMDHTATNIVAMGLETAHEFSHLSVAADSEIDKSRYSCIGGMYGMLFILK